MTDLQDLPPTARLVYKTLEHEGPLTYTEIAESARMPDSSLNDALDDLTDHDFVDCRSHDSENSRVYVAE